MIENVTPYADLILKTFNIIVLVYAFYKFTKKPENDILTRLSKLEARVDENERSLNNNWEITRGHQDTLDDIQLCILYLLDFEVAYCAHFSKGEEKIDTTDLDEARNIIRKRLKK